MDLRSWLSLHGLDRLGDRLEAAEIDVDILAELTDADLRELGLSLGDRKRVLKAIAALDEPPTPATASAAPTPQRDAERRHLTVLFADLVGSTALASCLDPEDMREIIQSYQRVCAAAIERSGGHIAKFLGDGVLAYFGYPVAHEDDAERAARCGLELVRAVAALSDGHGTALASRVGIDTGLVVVGDLIGEGAAKEEAVIGETPNIAARLQALAEPDAIVVSDRTKRLLASAFTYLDLGGQTLKGVERPVRAWLVVAHREAESRFDARVTGAITDLVGRDEEVALLHRSWERARSGEGQVVMVCGEAGVGKSRVTAALRARIEQDGGRSLLLQCSPFYTNTAFHPVLSHLERVLELAAAGSIEARLDRLGSLVRQAGLDPGTIVPLLAALLGLPLEPVQDLSPQRRKERTIAALADYVLGLSQVQALLVLVEDAHWMDPTTLELLHRLVEHSLGQQLLLVITFRPEFEPAWGAFPHVVGQTLSRLGYQDSGGLIDKVTGGKALPAAVREEIIRKTDGIPLFLEELTKAVLESGLLIEQADHYALSSTPRAVEIPSTLHDSLMARLDRLLPAKQIAQIGATIGREFTYGLLSAVAGSSPVHIEAALTSLVASQLVFQRGSPPTSSYTFKHALVQDAAYVSILRARRRQLHQAIALAIEAQFPDIVEAEPELVAHHYTEAGQIDRAVVYWHRAGTQAAAHSANAEAIGHLRKGLELARARPPSHARAEQELMLLNALAAPTMNSSGYASPETVRVYDEARQLCGLVGESVHIFQALAGVSTYRLVRGDALQGLALAEEMLTAASRATDLGPLIETHRLIGLNAAACGQLTKARRHLEQVRELFDPDQRQRWALAYGQDHLMSSLSLSSWVMAALGYPDQAHAQIRDSLLEAKQSGHLFSQAYAQAVALLALYWLGETEMMLRLGDDAIGYATEHGILYYVAFAGICQGWARTRSGELAAGIEQMRAGIAGMSAAGATLLLPKHHVMLAEGLIEAGAIEEASLLLDQALAHAERSGERESEADVHRIHARLCLARDPADHATAEEYLDRALSVARSQEARLPALLAAMALARLWADLGKADAARDMLAGHLGCFTEGFGVPTLVAAREFLVDLG